MREFKEFEHPAAEGGGGERKEEELYQDLIHDAMLALHGNEFAPEERVAAALAKLSEAEEAARLIADEAKRHEALEAVSLKRQEIEGSKQSTPPSRGKRKP